MPLVMKEFLTPDDYIEDLNGDKYIITADIPREIYEKFSVVIEETSQLNSGNFTAEEFNKALDNARGITIAILSIKNDASNVEKFINGMSLNAFIPVFKYIGEYLANSISGKKK
jgi:hypothetical protein